MLITPKDLADQLGIKYDTLRKHISRNKLFRSGKLIDTTFAANNAYIMDATNGKGLDVARIGNKSDSDTAISDGPKVDLKEPDRSEPSKEDIIASSLGLRRKIADAEKAEKDNELKTLELAKKMGELMPVEMVEKILTVNIRHIIHESKNEWENIASTYTEILGGNRSHLSQMVEALNKHMDKLVKEVKKKAAEEIKQVIRDYSEVRSRGQRK